MSGELDLDNNNNNKNYDNQINTINQPCRQWNTSGI